GTATSGATCSTHPGAPNGVRSIGTDKGWIARPRSDAASLVVTCRSSGVAPARRLRSATVALGVAGTGPHPWPITVRVPWIPSLSQSIGHQVDVLPGAGSPSSSMQRTPPSYRKPVENGMVTTSGAVQPAALRCGRRGAAGRFTVASNTITAGSVRFSANLGDASSIDANGATLIDTLSLL